jgi:hypothetical protein
MRPAMREIPLTLRELPRWATAPTNHNEVTANLLLEPRSADFILLGFVMRTKVRAP